MKSIRLSLSILAAFVALGASSCVKEYECTCTYVPDPIFAAGQATREEVTEVEARTIEDAEDKCDDLEPKYQTQSFDGNCVADR